MLISWLPDIVQKCFYTPDRAINPTFQMRYVPFSIIVAGDISQTVLSFFNRAATIREMIVTDKGKKRK